MINDTILVLNADTTTGHAIARALVSDTSLMHVRLAARHRESVDDLLRVGGSRAEHVTTHATDDPAALDALYHDVHIAILAMPAEVGANQSLSEIAEAYAAAALRSPTVTRAIVMSVFRGNRGFPSSDVWQDVGDAETKAATILSGTRVACTVLRVGWVQQVLVYLAELVRARAVLPLPLGHHDTSTIDKARVAPVNIKDVAAAVRTCIAGGRHAGDTAGRTFDLVGPPPAISGPDMAAAMSREYGAEIVYRDVSDADMRHILAAVPDMAAFEVDVHMSMFSDIRDGYHAAPGSDLGFLLPRPAETLAEFLHENASQFRPEQ